MADNEITVMLKIEKLLRPLPLAAQGRVLAYFSELVSERATAKSHAQLAGEPKAD
jgi:hypothetical protein